MSKALVVIKSPGIGDVSILLNNVHQISAKIGNPVTVLAQRSTRASAIFKHDPYVNEIIDLGKKDFFNVIKKIKTKNFDQSYIYSDSIRLYLICKLSGIRENFHYKFFSKKGKNFFKTAKEFTEKTLQEKINLESKIYWDKHEIDKIKKNYDISNNTKNIVCGISASGPTKRWDIGNYIKLFEKINSKFQCKFFLAGGPQDEILIKKLTDSSIGKCCISFSKLNMEQIIPLIATCDYYIGNDTGFGHIAANLNCKCLILFFDSPASAYGLWSSNIEIVVPDGETIESCGHNTRGKDKVSVDKVFKKALELLS